MQESLYQIDVVIFYFINHNLQNAVCDWLMPLISDGRKWFPFFGIIYIWLWWKGGKNGRIAAILIIFVILLSDQLSSAVLKPLFGRQRPCVVLTDVNMLTGLKTSFSFPSSHAANSFAAAVLFTHYLPRCAWAVFTLAFLSGFSRIYLGVHYPSDVLGGAVLGLLCAQFVIQAYSRAEKFYEKRKPSHSEAEKLNADRA